MVQIKQLKDDNGNLVYPRTTERAVLDENGNSLESKMASILQSIGNLATVATTGSYNDLTDIPGTSVTEVTYAELVELKNNSLLIKGNKYRITDYVTTTTQSDTQSAGHQFDVIVQADDVNVLNENALAIQHEGDNYFASNNLSAWELKYDINNDTSKYLWADTTNGKGVIWYMKDENNNVCFYDFKNIMFKRYFVFSNQSGGGVTSDDDTLTTTLNTAVKSKYLLWNSEFNMPTHSVRVYASDTSDYLFCYTFSRSGTLSVSRDLSIGTRIKNNYIGKSLNYGVLECNNIIFYWPTSTNGGWENNVFGENCAYNTFYGTDYNNNIFGDHYCYNIACGSLNSNTFGSDSEHNLSGLLLIQHNTFGNNFDYNLIITKISDNKFGSGCGYNTLFGNNNNNIFGNNCLRNLLYSSSSNNDFGNNVNYITLGKLCKFIKIEHDCSYIITGDENNIKDYYNNITIEPENEYIYLDCTETTSSSVKCLNVLVLVGVNNTTTYKTLTVPTAGNVFKTTFKTGNEVDIIV